MFASEVYYLPYCLLNAHPQCVVTPGQAAVVYIGDEVVGGGTIERPV